MHVPRRIAHRILDTDTRGRTKLAGLAAFEAASLKQAFLPRSLTAAGALGLRRP